MLQQQRSAWQGWVLVLPAISILGLVFVYPIGRAAWLSFFAQNLGTRLQPEFVGMGNYERLLSDGRFWSSVGHTLFFTGVSVTIELALGLAIALVLDRTFRGRSLVRAIAIMPWALPTALVALGWSWLFNDSFGVVNDLLLRLGLIAEPVVWLGDPQLAMATAIAADVWKTTSFMSILLLAGLQSIPQSLYEAHALDGASAWQSFRRITLPLLLPQMTLAVLFRAAQAFGVFDLIQVLTGGGPAGATETIAIYIYTTVMRYLDFGYGSALVVVVFLVLMSVVAVAAGLLRRFQLTEQL
ncbi:MAG: sugar ABC transporter permease [Cyanobacteria bacterium J06641_5]